MQPDSTLPVVILAASVLLLTLLSSAVWLIRAYNDLTRRRARVIALWADVKSMRARRHGVAHSLSRHVGKASAHEREVARHGSRRGRPGRGGGARFTSVTDNNNGWPASAAVGTARQAMTVDVRSHDLENQAWQELHREAEAYNASVGSFPRLIVAPAMGFRTWRFAPSARQHCPSGNG